MTTGSVIIDVMFGLIALGVIVGLLVLGNEVRSLRFLLSRTLDVPNLPTALRRDIELVLKKR